MPTLLWFHANGRNKSQYCWAQQCWVLLANNAWALSRTCTFFLANISGRKFLFSFGHFLAELLSQVEGGGGARAPSAPPPPPLAYAPGIRVFLFGHVCLVFDFCTVFLFACVKFFTEFLNMSKFVAQKTTRSLLFAFFPSNTFSDFVTLVSRSFSFLSSCNSLSVTVSILGTVALVCFQSCHEHVERIR